MDKNNFSALNREQMQQVLEELVSLRNDTSEEEGARAVGAFAYRCALRIMPFYGENPVSSNWQEQAPWHFYNVIRAYIACHQWLTVGIDKDKLNEFANGAIRATSDSNTVVKPISYVVQIAKDASAIGQYASTAYTTVRKAFYGHKDALDIFKVAVNEDYQFLLDSKNSVEKLLERPLWPTGAPSSLAQYERSFYADLQQSNLNKIADDIDSLVNNKFEPKAALKYLKNLSESDIQTMDDLYKIVAEYFETVDNFAVRALLIGPGGAGKTSLADLIEFGKTEKKKKPTVGIDYRQHGAVDLSIHYGKLADENKLLNPDIYLWDFGGQAIYHSLHHAFMHENCVYIVVVDSRHEQAPEPWLHQIYNVAGPQAKVLIVTNWFDGIKTKQNRSALLRKFPQLIDENCFFDFSCRNTNDKGFTRFINHLVLACSDSTKEIFADTKRAFDLLENAFKDQKYIRLNELKGILLQEFAHFSKQDLVKLTHKLKEFGRFIELSKSSSDNNEQYVCLDPNSTVRAAYRMVHENSVQKAGGIKQQMKSKDLKHKNVLDFMCQHGVAVKLPDFFYFVPDAAPIAEPAIIKQWFKKGGLISLGYELAYLPIGLRAKVASSLIAKGLITEPKRDVWRDGFIARLSDNDKKGAVIVEYQNRYNSIALYLIGELASCAKLLGVIDKHLLSAVAGVFDLQQETNKGKTKIQLARQILKYPIFSTAFPYNDNLLTNKTTDVETLRKQHQQLVKGSGLNILLLVDSEAQPFAIENEKG